MPDGDWKSSTFVLGPHEVAQALGVEVSTVLDLMMAGALGFWIPPSPLRRTQAAAMTARFDPADVDAYRTAKPLPEVESAMAILDNLRAYLASHEGPVTIAYEEAVRLGAPLAVREHVHVRAIELTKFAVAQDAPIGAQLRQLTEKVLASVGAVRVRGLRPDDGTRQRWAFWWRLPDAVVVEGGSPSLSEFLRPRGALADDETTVEAPDGSGPMVDTPMVPDEDPWK